MLLALLLAVGSGAAYQPSIISHEGRGPDGGVWAVYVVNPSGGGEGGGLTDTELRATPVPVSGSLTCSGPLTDAQLRAAAVPVSGTFYQTTQPVSGTLTCNAGSGTQAVSLATLPALTAGSAVIGHVVVDTAPTTAVTGTFFQTTQPVSLASAPTTAVTNAGLSNLDVALSTRTKPADQQHTIIDSSASIAVTGPLTDAQLRAAVVPVSDTPRTVSSANQPGTCTSVTTSSTTILASNASRKAWGLKASESNTVAAFCKLGATATSSNMSFGAGSAFYQDTGAVYTGVVDCITASSAATVCVIELQ